MPLVREIPADSVASWVMAQNALGYICQCGCGERIEVQPHHKKNGVPRFIANHHQQLRKGEPRTPYREGQLTVREAAAALGLDELVLRRLDAKVNGRVPGAGVRFFTSDDIVTLREVLTGRGAGRRPAAAPDSGQASAAGAGGASRPGRKGA